jgi:hypothetical protein
LDKKIDVLHKEYNKNTDVDNLAKLTETQNELKLLREKKIEGIIYSGAKARWHLEGSEIPNTCTLQFRESTLQ